MKIDASDILKADGEATMSVSIKAVQKLIHTIQSQSKEINGLTIRLQHNIVRMQKMEEEITSLKQSQFGTITDITI